MSIKNLSDRRQIKMGRFSSDDLFWLDHCEKHDWALLKNGITDISRSLTIVPQPSWKLEEPPVENKKGAWSVEFSPNKPDTIAASVDALAFYSPLHFNGPDRYGVYLCAPGIVYLAHEIMYLLGDTLLELSNNVREQRRLCFYWAAQKLFLHEMCHAFIEHLVYVMEPFTGKRCYEKAKEKFLGIKLMEEALCNSFVCGMHKSLLANLKGKGEFGVLASHADALHDILITFMRRQPAGYKDFLVLEDEPQNSELFIKNCQALLACIYGISLEQQYEGIYTLWGAAGVAIWRSVSGKTKPFTAIEPHDFNVIDKWINLITPTYFYSPINDPVISANTYNGGGIWQINDINKRPVYSVSLMDFEIDLEFHEEAEGEFSYYVERYKLDQDSETKSVRLSGLGITSLRGSPKKFKNFDCSNNKLTSLYGGPEEVSGFYCCSNNQLHYFENMPLFVGFFDCTDNKIDELKDIGTIYLQECTYFMFDIEKIRGGVLGFYKVKNLIPNNQYRENYEWYKIIMENRNDIRAGIDALRNNGYRWFARF